MWIDDRIIKEAENDQYSEIWIPDQTFVVCGRSNEPEVECYVEKCSADGVEILQRFGGGGTVVLHPGCVIVSLGAWVSDYYKNDVFFKIINQTVIDSFSKYNDSFSGMSQDGLSDIVFGEKKIAGTSLFRSRNYLLYQASILVENSVELFETYLRHPSKEPDYRSGRSHSDFVGDLQLIDSSLSVNKAANVLKENFPGQFAEAMKDHLVSSQAPQLKHLFNKIQN
jgi:lipoate-protein ligase A